MLFVKYGLLFKGILAHLKKRSPGCIGFITPLQVSYFIDDVWARGDSKFGEVGVCL